MNAAAPNREALLRQRAMAARLLKAKEAKDGLIAFTEFTMPDVADPDDATKTRYDAQFFHRSLAAALEEVERGTWQRLIITFPPRHGKSELASKRFPAWAVGRKPQRHVMVGTYNQDFADDFGNDVRSVMVDRNFATVFPDCVLKKGSRATDRLGTTKGGKLAFVGRGGSATGRGADILIIDDPLKDRSEANSPVIREEVWSWFQDTMSTRLMSDTGAIIIIQTRWHEDDLVGRLTDPLNPHYNPEEAAQWKVINIPAIAEEDDALGRRPGEALWESRFGIAWLERKKAGNPLGFASLYQQKPTPEDGVFFLAEHLATYRLQDRPPRELLKVYGASDHAVGLKQRNDYTCLLIVGVDADDVIWLLDCWWERKDSEKVVEAMIDLQEKWRPLNWWAEKGHISQSIGPFLRRRMRERKAYINLTSKVPIGDKQARAQSIQARASQGMVRLPSFATWYQRAVDELLKFPFGTHDDFVDALALIGLGLGAMTKGRGEARKAPALPRVGTLGWVKSDANFRRKRERRISLLGGM